MRSLVSAERETDRSGGQPMLVGYLGEGGLNPSSEAPDPEHRALSSIYDGRLLAAIMAAINDDPMLVALASAVCDGIEGEALQQLLGVSAGELATSRRKLKRRIDATRNRDLGTRNGR